MQLLNMKNDFLRKRFDGIKYDVKKIEEVNFEIALRGLDMGKKEEVKLEKKEEKEEDRMELTK